MSPIEIMTKFPTELAAVQYLETVRWGVKPKCTHCNSENVGNRGGDMRLRCKDCNKRFSVTSGTLINSTNLPIRTWLVGISIVCNAKKGLSALQLQRDLNLNYATAFKMYHRLRDFMAVENQYNRLDGITEMDETYVGGKPRRYQNAVFGKTKAIPEFDAKIAELADEYDFINPDTKPKKARTGNAKRGRGTDKTPVVGIVQRDGNVVAEVMQKTGAANITKMVKKYVDLDNSVLLTDEYKSYSRLDAIIEHIKIDHNKMYSYRGLNTNSIESFWAIVKRGIMGQYHQVSDKYLQRYVDEFCFKYNNRKDDDMFETLISIMVLAPNEVNIPELPKMKPKKKELSSKQSVPKNKQKTAVKPPRKAAATAAKTTKKAGTDLKTKPIVIVSKPTKTTTKPITKSSKKDDYLPF
jgi:transposase-like protein